MKAAILIIILMAAALPLSAQPNLDVIMTPVHPPILIPAQGGSFHFIASVVNHGPSQVPIFVWLRIRQPNGQYMPFTDYITLNPPVGVLVSRLGNQNVPSTWIPGVYTYIGYCNVFYSYPPIDADSFTFTKSADSGEGPFVLDAGYTGDPLPYEVVRMRSVASDFRLIGATPNPFNPSTVLSYELRAASLVSLKVYDTAGRLVATLLDGWREAGTHKVTFNGSKLASGVYLYTLQAGVQTSTGKMLLLK